MRQFELYFRVYLVKFVQFWDLIWLPVPAMIGFLPYIYVDNVWSLIAGREISGFPKLLANFEIPSPQTNPPLQPYPIEAYTLAFQYFGPNAHPQMVNFLTIEALAAAQANIPVRND